MNSYFQKQIAIIAKVINMASVLLLFSFLSSCGNPCIPNANQTDCLPPTSRPPTPTLAPPPVPELIEVRAGPGDGTKVDPDKLSSFAIYGVLPAGSIRIVIRQIDFLHFGLVVTINDESISQAGSDQMRGDDAKFTYEYIQNGNEGQELITVMPRTEDRTGPGFTIKISSTSGNMTSQPLGVVVFNPNTNLPSCVEKSLPVAGGPISPPDFRPDVLPSNEIALMQASAKVDAPGKTYFKVAIQSKPYGGILMEIVENSSLNSDESLISLINKVGWNKTIRALDSTCKYTKELVALPDKRSVGPMKITKLDTTTLVLFKDVGITDLTCIPPNTVCTKMLAVWSEPLFWEAFGGKNVTFTWSD